MLWFQASTSFSRCSNRVLLLADPQSQSCLCTHQGNGLPRRRNSRFPPAIASASVCEFAADVAHNKVLVAAAVTGVIGQLSKPFTSAILYGKRNTLDVGAAFQAGGFPSTHSSASIRYPCSGDRPQLLSEISPFVDSSLLVWEKLCPFSQMIFFLPFLFQAVVAAATILGLERGFSDALFGLAVVYASLVMYDAQGVRREVGIHAKAFNHMLAQKNSIPPGSDPENLMVMGNGNSFSQPTKPFSNSECGFGLEVNPVRRSRAIITSEQVVNENFADKKGQSSGQLVSSPSLASSLSSSSNTEQGGEPDKVVIRLKESVGHNEIEVMAGAFLGFFVSLAVYNLT